jgi:hypothetical protein
VQAVLTVPPGKSLRNVTDVVEVKVVQDDELRVPSADDVLLEIVGAEAIGQCFADERVLG